MILNEDQIRRMIDLSGLSMGSAGGSGGGGGGSISAGAFVTTQYYNQNFGLLYKQVTTDGTTSEVTTQFLTAAPNEIPTVGTTTDPTTGDVTVTSLIGQQVKNALVIGEIMMVWDETNNAIKVVNRDGTTAANFYATGGVSALGYSPGGGGGGGADLNALLDSINTSSIGSTAPGSSDVGKCLIWTANGWAWGTTGSGGGGTVTSVATGTGLTGGPITGSGTISINSTYQTYISHGQTAYGWGNHAEAGYLTSSAIADMATKTWVNNQNFATQSWVNAQGFVKSSGVTSVGLSMPTGFTVGGSPITTSGTISVSITSGYFLPTTTQKNTWDAKQDAISDLSTIRSNASHGEAAYNSLGNYLLKTEGMQFFIIDNYVRARFNPDEGRTAKAQGTGFIEWWASGGYFNHHMGSLQANGNVTVGTGNTDTTHYLQIGGGRLFWDNANNALYVQKADGTAAHFYATGGVSALGMSVGGTPSMNAITLQNLTVNGSATINTLAVTNEIETLDVNIMHVTNELWVDGNNINMDGGNIDDAYQVQTTQMIVGSGGSTIKKIYWDGTYLQVQIGTTTYKFRPDATA